MPEYQAPGVYVEEQSTGSKSVEGVSTSVAGFPGETVRGPVEPQLVTSYNEFERIFGSSPKGSNLQAVLEGDARLIDVVDADDSLSEAADSIEPLVDVVPNR